MVSLYELMVSQQQFSHLSTGIPSLDDLFLTSGLGRHRLYDFQAGPGCSCLYTVTASLVVSHMKNNRHNKTVIIDTLDAFPWHYVESHPDFDPQWLDRSLVSYTADTFSKLYLLVLSKTLAHDGPEGSTMVIVNGYHELLELYKLELSETYEETMLKSHIVRNAITIANQLQYVEVGTTTPLPELPSQSDLVRESPVIKYESHVSKLLQAIYDIAYKHSTVCIVMGHLDTAYQADSRPSSSQNVSANASRIDPSQSFSRASVRDTTGRIVLAPSTRRAKSVLESSDSLISARVVFYRDWYFKSTHFKENFPPLDPGRPVSVNKAQLRMVFAAKVESAHMSPVYFDHDNELYHLDDDEYREPDPPRYAFLDLSRSSVPVGPMHTQQYTYSTETYSDPLPTENQLRGLEQSTQTLHSPAGAESGRGDENARETVSSPSYTSSEPVNNHAQTSQESYVEESDDGLGSLLKTSDL